MIEIALQHLAKLKYGHAQAEHPQVLNFRLVGADQSHQVLYIVELWIVPFSD